MLAPELDKLKSLNVSQETVELQCPSLTYDAIAVSFPCQG